MKESATLQEQTIQNKMGKLLRTNKFAMFLEIIIIFLPSTIGLMISEATGNDTISIGGIEILGGPMAYLGLSLTLVIFWVTSRLRGASWATFGLTRPKSWLRTLLLAFGVAIGILGVVVLVINPLINVLSLDPRDMSRFEILTGSVPNLIVNIVLMWITAAFLEELLWRGYLMNRLIDLQGKQTKIAWAIALIGSAIIFGLFHFYQGPVGIIRTGAIGLVFGAAYLIVGRNLWPLIIAHGLIDTIDFIVHYFGS